jgi:NAD(P)-dependent dehydrogenase (short-subunit alcohol dehydrogenase family)
MAVPEGLFDVRGARVAVTGAASGLGVAMAEVMLDVADAAQVNAVIDGVAADQGGLDVVFANAGISLEPGIRDPGGGITAINPEAWDRVLKVNLEGVIFTIADRARRRAVPPGPAQPAAGGLLPAGCRL